MEDTVNVSSFSDDFRNTLKSGFGNEGEPSFVTNGKKDLNHVFSNIKGEPTNFKTKTPLNVIQYIEAHDNLTLFDIICQSIRKDPSIEENNIEVHKRIRLSNLLLLTSQGIPFIHSGQEYGRTKQFKASTHKFKVLKELEPFKSHCLVDDKNCAFIYPYFIHDSYNSSDAINHFDWEKVTNKSKYKENVITKDYTKGLIHLRRNSNAFKFEDKKIISERVKLIKPIRNDDNNYDLAIGFSTFDELYKYLVFVNADLENRAFNIKEIKDFIEYKVIVDSENVNEVEILNPKGFKVAQNEITLDKLSSCILRKKI